MKQIQHEVELFMKQTYQVYQGLGFKKIKTYLATRPGNYAGDRAEWDQAEEMLRKVGAEEAPGEGAFYGPKIEFHLEDARGRCWQCGTIQLDFVLPSRMEMRYIDQLSQPLKPVILHRAILGSLERFMAILLESTQGWVPFWLAPVQVVIVPVDQRHLKRAAVLQERLCDVGVRAIIVEPGSVGKHMKSARIQRIPRAWLIGDKEVDYVSERDLCSDAEFTKPDTEAVDELAALNQFPSE
jgi:threonyl-tRNA synthetase